jgi:quinol monooxygenase YgiN
LSRIRRLTCNSYDDVEASTITHRSSAEYKTFRAAVGEEGLLERPSDLRFWRPTTIGFLTQSSEDDSSANFIARGNQVSYEKQQYIVVDELKPRLGQKEDVLNQMRSLVALAERQTGVLSFWVLRRDDNEQDDSLMVFSRYDSKDAGSRFCNQKDVSGIWDVIASLTEQNRTTTWVESGLGFLARSDHLN